MSSVSQQLLANLSWKAWAQASDLHKRILFTLGVFFVYRIGTYIPIPGVDAEIMRSIAGRYTSSGGFLSMFNMVAGGALERMSVFALNLMPYISMSILIQLMTAIFPYFMALKKEGEAGKRKLNQYTRYGTVGLASFQALGVATWLSSQPSLVFDPGILFHLTTMVTLVGATLFLVWLGEQITARGIGNGSSMLIYAGIVASLPMAVFNTLELSRTGGVSSLEVLASIVGVAAIIAFVVFMERAYRKVVVQYPKRQVGQQVMGAEQSYMPIKLNSTGVLPPIFAMAVLGFFGMLGNWSMLSHVPFVQDIFSLFLSDGSIVYMCIKVFLIVFFAFFYTSVVFNPEETAENLRKNGAFISGYRPGVVTAQYLDYLLTRLTVVGAAYIAFVVILPNILNRLFHLNFPFQGTSFLIVVSVSWEIISQLHAYLISHQYQALIKRNQKRR